MYKNLGIFEIRNKFLFIKSSAHKYKCNYCVKTISQWSSRWKISLLNAGISKGSYEGHCIPDIKILSWHNKGWNEINLCVNGSKELLHCKQYRKYAMKHTMRLERTGRIGDEYICMLKQVISYEMGARTFFKDSSDRDRVRPGQIEREREA